MNRISLIVFFSIFASVVFSGCRMDQALFANGVYTGLIGVAFITVCVIYVYRNILK